MLTRLRATVWTVVVCGTVLSPIVQGFRDRPFDDFPLSWFPMFARPRPDVETPVYAVAVGGQGKRTAVGVQYWTSGGFNQGATQMLLAARQGRDALDPLCERIAAKVARRPLPDVPAPTEILILRGWYSRDKYFGEGDTRPDHESVLAKCPVPAATE
jgi:hypothetical protein